MFEGFIVIIAVLVFCNVVENAPEFLAAATPRNGWQVAIIIVVLVACIVTWFLPGLTVPVCLMANGITIGVAGALSSLA